MLRVTIELVPFGIEEEAHKIGTMLIANDGTGSYTSGNYGFVYNYTDRNDPMATGTIQNFPRHLGAWALIKKILNINTSETNEITDILAERINN